MSEPLALIRRLAFYTLGVSVCLPGIAQVGGTVARPNCIEQHNEYTFPESSTFGDKQGSASRTLRRASIDLKDEVVVEVIEHPQSRDDGDTYNSAIIVRQGTAAKTYDLQRLIKNGDTLRLSRSSLLSTGPRSGILILAFEAGSSGVAQGFAVLQFSDKAVEVKELPIVQQGKLVMSCSNLQSVELWSAQKADQGLCEACQKHYVVKSCSLAAKTITCGAKSKTAGPFDPDSIIQHSIEVR